ncbi:hypothetical protein F2P79_000923 [Pimephales promelas]|nr:hypothetical protein F2P79_000923 [Pimephales promelas]
MERGGGDYLSLLERTSKLGRKFFLGIYVPRGCAVEHEGGRQGGRPPREEHDGREEEVSCVSTTVCLPLRFCPALSQTIVAWVD